jgi:hypothetical protein
MNRRHFLFGTTILFLLPLPAVSRERRLSGPYGHENLSIYLIHGEGDAAPVPLTLAEAMQGKTVEVIETADVNELKVKNIGSKAVFIQAGDIVKGGKQDRVLAVSLLLPPKSGLVPIDSFCVEQGRWEQREGEKVEQFASAEKALPSKNMKLAMKANDLKLAAPENPTEARSIGTDTSSRQQAMWDEVKKTKNKLSAKLGEAVASERSESSLQLALENVKLETTKARFQSELLKSVPIENDVVGLAFAINGKINSADVYQSNGLFRKLWPKLLDAAVTEAVAEEVVTAPAPGLADIERFLDGAEQGQSRSRKLLAGVDLDLRETTGSLYSETRSGVGAALHRNYLSKD